MITRRRIVVAVGACVLDFALPASAQRPARIKRAGFLVVSEEAFVLPLIASFNQAMRELGNVEGKDYAVELKSAHGDVKLLPALAAELVALGVDVIVSTGTPNTFAARSASRTIPIVMVTTSDPVGTGLVASLARPGGNITGLTNLTSELALKRLELLREITPSLRRVGFLHNPDSPADRTESKLIAADAEKLGVRVIAAANSFGQDLTATFAMLKREKAEALMVTSGTNLDRRAAIVNLANRNRLPSIFGNSAFVADGGLLSYAPDWSDQYRRAAGYVDKIFKGAKPGELPIERPTKFELVVNMKTAKALGIRIPQSILVRADRVIE